MPASTIDYEIHSLHINVGNGDGAIHLLVEPGEATNTVHRAILVDGGKPATVDQILKTIKYVEDSYKIVDPDGNPQVDDHSITNPKPVQLRFDGIVVSRWAIDHSAG
jgi:acetolactate synthase small subunit